MHTNATLAVKTVNLALQGGGSHGAFTWGVLDALLSDPRIRIEGLSGTSAGALNAVALASGMATAHAQGLEPHEGARQALAQLWEDVGHWGALGALQAQLSRSLWGGLLADWGGANPWSAAWRGMLSPQQTNPLGLNPLRDLLTRHVDFDAIRRPGGPKVFVSATHVSTGKAVIFSGERLTADAVLASACLPTLFQPVEIDGQAYWDGGYSVNPALTPLIGSCEHADVVVVQINPLRRDALPQTAGQITDRVNELTFNASLLTQMRGIDLINRLLAAGALVPGRCKQVRLHRIDGGAAMLEYAASTKSQPDPGLIRELFQLGQMVAHKWLEEHFAALGHRSTVDVKRDYEDDTRVDWAPPATPGGPRRMLGFRPWVARLLKRGG
ncbi:MAG TPA: patatin-like phospholipase family protein [Ramlibacter sp.]|nr:patatin-like phospholipase family protein [Ramlibacter sp.]